MKKYLKYAVYIVGIFVVANFIYLFFYGRYLALRVMERPASAYLSFPLIQYEGDRFSMDRFFIGYAGLHVIYRERSDRQILFPFLEFRQTRRAWKLYQFLIGSRQYFLCIQNYSDPIPLSESDYVMSGFGLGATRGLKYTIEEEEMKKVINYFLKNQEAPLPQIAKVVHSPSCSDFGNIKGIIDLPILNYKDEPDILKFKNEFKKQL